MKKVLFTIIVVCLFQNCICGNKMINRRDNSLRTNMIDNYLRITAESFPDTIEIDSSYVLTVVFENITDSCITFYPHSKIFLARLTAGFDYHSLYLREYTDLTYEYKLDAHCMYKESYLFQVESPVFGKGNNYWQLCYLFNYRYKGVKELDNNRLKGLLESKKYMMFVK